MGTDGYCTNVEGNPNGCIKTIRASSRKECTLHVSLVDYENQHLISMM
jgi:hypothetical protein